MSLYYNITHIRWDYESKNVKGYVSVPKKNDIHPFSVDPTKSSEVFIADYLWDLMD